MSLFPITLKDFQWSKRKHFLFAGIPPVNVSSKGFFSLNSKIYDENVTRSKSQLFFVICIQLRIKGCLS